ncbi:MAG: DolP-mannose mannosyltransferase [bacterium]
MNLSNSLAKRQSAVMLILLAVTVFNASRHYPARQPVLLDFSLDYYFAQEIGKGRVLYRDAWDHKTPLTRYLAAACYRLSRSFPGIDFILSVRFLFIGLLFITSLVIYFLVKDWFSDDWIAFLASFIFILQNDVMNFACSGPASKILMNLMGLTSLWMIRKRGVIPAGMFAALAFLDWQPGILFTAPFIVYLFHRSDDLAANVLKYLLGFCLPVAAFLLYFQYHNALGYFIDSTYWFNTMRVSSQFNLVVNSKMFFSKLVKLQESAWFFGGLAGCLAYPLFRKNRSVETRRNLDQLYLLTVGTLTYSFVNFNDLRDITPFTPLVAIWLAALFGLAGRTGYFQPGGFRKGLFKGGVLTLFLATSLPHTISFNLARPVRVIYYRNGEAVSYVNVVDFDLKLQKRYIKEFLGNNPGRLLVIWPLEFLVLKGLSNPISFPCFTEDSYRYIEKYYENGWKGIMDRIKSYAPETIVMRPEGRGDPLCMADLRRFVKDNHYRLKFTIDKPDGPACIYVRDHG